MRNWVWKEPDTPTIVSQSGKMDSDSRALSLRDATLYRRLVAKLNYLAMDRPHTLRCIDRGELRVKPERCGYGQTQESGAISDRATDHLDALQVDGDASAAGC